MLRLWLIFILIGTTIFPADYKFGDSETDFKKIQTVGISTIKQKNGRYKLELSRRKLPDSELLLNFENRKMSDLRDVLHHYTIDSASYGIERSDESILGKRIARFTGKNHYISVRAEKNTLLGSELMPEDFYFSFFIKPEIFEGNNTLFAKTYYSHGKKYSLNMEIVKNKLSLSVENLFSFKSKETKSLHLESGHKIDNRKWTHVVIFFNVSENEVIIYEDGMESVRQNFPVLDGEQPQFGIHKNDTTPLVIGKNYYGRLDNFLVAKGSPDFEAISKSYYGVEYDEANSIAFQKNGKVFSGVFKTKYSNSYPVAFTPKLAIPEGTSSNIFLRISNKPFSQDDTSLKWISAEKFSELKNTSFQYFQWMAVLRSDHSGILTPALHSVLLNYKETVPPVSPTGLRVLKKESSELNLCLAWDSNKEENVKNKGGYIIHYGLSPDKMAGTIYYINEKKEYIYSTKLCINNDLISVNSIPDAERNLPFFEQGKTYYFRVSAFNDKFDPVQSPDQKSIPSKPILFSFESDPLD